LEEQNGKLHRDLQVLRESAFRRPSAGDEKASRKEKIILESLSHRVEELEVTREGGAPVMVRTRIGH
jgi:hypothetical protein